jgi:hypothetical protein
MSIIPDRFKEQLEAAATPGRRNERRRPSEDKKDAPSTATPPKPRGSNLFSSRRTPSTGRRRPSRERDPPSADRSKDVRA